MENTIIFLDNVCDIIWSLENKYRKTCEIGDDFDINDQKLTFSVTTKTACSDPKVNYYDDGEDSVVELIEELKEKLQNNKITFQEDWDCDEYGSIMHSHYIIIDYSNDNGCWNCINFDGASCATNESNHYGEHDICAADCAEWKGV